MNNREKVDQVVNRHALKAQQSAYDRDTCVLAVLKVRETLMMIADELDEKVYVERVVQALDELFDTYHDSEGEYTSGRGVIGALRDEIYAVLER